MMTDARAKEPFRFWTRLHLRELTHHRASNIEQLLDGIEHVPGSVIYHHTHHFLQQHQYLTPEPPNDFAYWVREILGDRTLGERLASIDTIEFHSIRSLRNAVAETIAQHLKENPASKRRFADPGHEFHFIKAISFVLPTGEEARTIQDFVTILEHITIDALYYHVFEARLRHQQPTNDFALWFETSMGLPKLAESVSRLDPYSYTMENLRHKILNLVRSHLKEEEP